MCGRYEVIDGKRVYSRFKVAQPMLPIPDNRDVRPTQQVVVLQTDHVLSLMQWGLVPAWARDPHIGSKMINARAETIASKPSFKRPLRYQRCIIPASAFFEWQGSPGAKVKYRIGRKDADLFSFAGLYDTWRDPTGSDLTTCTIITTQPNELVAPIHNRMPVILLPEDEDRWLDPDMTEPEEIVSLLRPYPADLMMARRA
ncbi:MAG TPA: SOS response-associated peptidase [Ktedonobacterales bacterium]|nr:SOS response-associated peptidase [Ktedonobacterales bacterium]